MRLYENYIKEVVLGKFWKNLEEELLLGENDGGDLSSLLDQANNIVFNKFKINPQDKAYFIAGSARLYLYPLLRESFNLTNNIGDLDIVIPNKQLWVNAGLEKEWNANGIYRPSDESSVEVFNIWDPSKAGGEYANYKARPTNEILNDCTLINGYYYMSLVDIMDYKSNLSRDKEQDVVSLISQYQKSSTSNRSEFLKKIVRAIGLGKTKEFLGIVNK